MLKPPKIEGFVFSELREKVKVDCTVVGEAGAVVVVSLNPEKEGELGFTVNVKGWDIVVEVVVVDLSLKVVDLEAYHKNDQIILRFIKLSYHTNKSFH